MTQNTDSKSQLDSLWNISPIDGRYLKSTHSLRRTFSEGGLILFRIQVEAAWLLHLCETLPELKKALTAKIKSKLESWVNQEDTSIAAKVKEIEITTKHDVKACEYAIRQELEVLNAPAIILSHIHFGATSEDINNLAYSLMQKQGLHTHLIPMMEEVKNALIDMQNTYKSAPMLARTHGQTASPTTMGKELAVFVSRLDLAWQQVCATKILGKMNGAVGNFHAHHIAYPEIDWPQISKDFVERQLNLSLNPLTTQIENHDQLACFLNGLTLTNAVLLDLVRDIWTYISLGYFSQKTVAGEVGSSTMPHKVNPIDFENAEGNLGLANALCQHLAIKLPISRLQRDLTDSTVLRNLGVIFSHCCLSYKSILRGLGKLEINETSMEDDLKDRWEVLSEAIQSVLRRYGVDDAYERLKDASRGRVLRPQDISRLINDSKELPEEAKQRLLKLTPEKYVGLATELTEQYGIRCKRHQ